MFTDPAIGLAESTIAGCLAIGATITIGCMATMHAAAVGIASMHTNTVIVITTELPKALNVTSQELQ